MLPLRHLSRNAAPATLSAHSVRNDLPGLNYLKIGGPQRYMEHHETNLWAAAHSEFVAFVAILREEFRWVHNQ